MSKNLSMREVALWLFVIMIVSFSIAGSIFFRTGGYNFLNNANFDHQIDQTQSFSVNGITEIQVNGDSPTINVLPIDGNEVIVHFYGYSNTSSENRAPKLSAEVKNNNLVVIAKQPPQTIGINLSIERSNLQIDVSVPKTYGSNITVKTSSGNATIEGFSLNTLTADASSGDLSVKSIQAKNCQLRTSSGNTFGEAINTDQFRSEASSGKIELRNLISKNSVLETSSGSISAHGLTGNLKADSSSGGIIVDYLKFENNIDVTASSGDVELHLPKDADFLLYANASSGTINNSFPIKTNSNNKRNRLEGTVGNGVNRINVSTSSGDITIRN